VFNGGVPLLGYALLRPHVGSDATALAIGAAIPVTVTVALFCWRRRVDPIGVLSVLGFGIAVLILVLSGGNPLVLKLQDAVVTGPIGLVCLVSVAVRRPLHLVVFQFLARHNPRWEHLTRDPGRRRTSTVITALIGAMLLLHAMVLLVLALTQPTSVFLALSRPVGWSVTVAGVAALLWYRSRMQARSGAREQGGA
jgi:FtsH-binding integral membrane protein